MSAALNKVFKGKFVRIYSTKIGTMQVEEDGHVSSVPSPVAHQGFFVDSDDNFVILGDKKGKRLVGMYAISLNIVEDIGIADENDLGDEAPIDKGALN
jgi:proteasome assembly chaperone (PAC2) family protein